MATKRILFVDSDSDTLHVFSRLLRQRGFEVLTASTMVSAWNVALHQPLDLLICGSVFADGTCTQLIQRMKLVKNIPSIVLSDISGERAIEDSLQAGFDIHLTKPIRFSVLEEFIQRLLETNTRYGSHFPGSFNVYLNLAY